MKFYSTIPNLTFALTALCGLSLFTNSSMANAPASARQAEVSTRGADVMPFELQATTHLFSKTRQGGVQQIIAKNPQDKKQIRFIRQHLQEIADQFIKGNFSGPAHIHGAAMPGLLALKKAQPGQIRITYQNLANGGQIQYATTSAPLVAALHQWFDAQLSDHGADAKEGKAQHDALHDRHIK